MNVNNVLKISNKAIEGHRQERFGIQFLFQCTDLSSVHIKLKVLRVQGMTIDYTFVFINSK